MDPVASCTEAPPRLTEESTPTNTHATTETGGASSTLPKRHNHTTVTTRGRGPNTRHNLGNGWTDPAWALSMAFIGPTQAGLQGRDILLLYTGPRDGGALDDILTQQQHDLGARLIAVDILRPPETGPNDIMDDAFYSTLCCAAAGGQLTFVGGGPNCRTWSILRWFPKPGAPRPVRGRDPSQTWGLESNSLEEQLDTDKDSFLLLRQMVITALASKARQQGVSTPSWNILVIQISLAGHRPPQDAHRYGPPEFMRSGQKRSSITRSTWTNADLGRWLGRAQPFQRTFHSTTGKDSSATTRNTLGHQS